MGFAVAAHTVGKPMLGGKMKRYGDVIDFLDDGEEEEPKRKAGFGIALRETEDGRFLMELAVMGSDDEPIELGYLNDRRCAEAFGKVLQLMASSEVETRTPTDEEIERYFKGRL